jgi:hypothetical protein
MATMQAPFDINREGYSYPDSGILIFGSDYGHADFLSPMVRFEFYDPLATKRADGSPIVFIRMGGSFQSGLSNGYQEAQSIFGQPNTDGSMTGFTANAVKGGLDAVYKQLAGGAASATGFISSAGLSGKAQYEFMTRKVLNTFQQLIYQGPTFRRFTLPFVMKPTSMQEAEKMISIVKTFRVASSAKGKQSVNETITPATANSVNTQSSTDTTTDTSSGFTAADISALFDTAAIDGGGSSNFSFGYPDMCRFEIVLQNGAENGGDTFLTQVFGSEFCVIENVQVDYGSQNKMVFFSPEGTTGGKYYPSEITLSINLRETSLPTADAITADHSNATRTIF